MHTEVLIDFGLLYSFLIVLARVSGFLIAIPLPGMNAAPVVTRIVLSCALSMCLIPMWPAVKSPVTYGDLTVWAVIEFAIGLAAGLGIAFLLEGFQIAAQAVGLQAGFSYASTIDPSTQADTAVLQTVLELTAGVLFFSLNLHLQVLKLLAVGLDSIPNASTVSKAFQPQAVIQFGSLMFTTGLRIALPVMGSLLLLDLAFALLSKVHSQLQLLSFSFSVKMLAGLVLLAATFSFCPSILTNAASRTLEILFRLLT